MANTHECDLVRDVQPSSRLLSRAGFQTLPCQVCGCLYTYLMKKLEQTSTSTRWEFNLIPEPDGEKIRQQKLDQVMAPAIKTNDNAGPKTERHVVE